MNPVNQAQMKEFAEAYDLTKKGESDQFELYSIYAIINGGSGENVDPFDVHLQGTEFGLDGVAIIVQGNIVKDADEAASHIADTHNPQIDFHFFQGKTSTGFDYGEMSKFFDGIKQFLASIPLAYVERTVYMMGYDAESPHNRRLLQAVS